MTFCEQINLSVSGELYRVIDLVGQESLFSAWYLDLTIELPLKVDAGNWLLCSAQCHWVSENETKRIFDGELVFVRNTSSFSAERQIVRLRLCSRFHRLGKSGGAIVFKDSCFREIMSWFVKKHYLQGQLEVIFAFDLDIEKHAYIQQLSGESDAEFIDRYCKTRGWSWLLRVSVTGRETVYFFKKSVASLPCTLHPDILNNKRNIFYQKTEKFENNTMIIGMNSLSPLIALGDNCELTGDNVVTSIRHCFEFSSEPTKMKQYRNQLQLADINKYPIPTLHRSVFSSPFQYGFVKSDTDYASMNDSGAYDVEILSDGLSGSARSRHAIHALLGYGGILSHFSGSPVGFQGLCYNNSEILLVEVDGKADTLKICGTLANLETINPVVSDNKTLYQWRTPRKISLSFEDGLKKPGIHWTTGVVKNYLMMGSECADKKQVELGATSGTVKFLGNQGISMVAGKKVREQISGSRHMVVDKELHLKNHRNKIHYEASRKMVFDFQRLMHLQSTQVHWRVKSEFLWSSKAVELDGGNLLHIKVPSGSCSVEAKNIRIFNCRQGALVLNNNLGISGISISGSGTITVKGTKISVCGTKTKIKGRVSSHALEPLMMPNANSFSIVELKEPGDLSHMTGLSGTGEYLCKELFDPFDQKTEEICRESGWFDARVTINGTDVSLDGMRVEKELNNAHRLSDLVLSGGGDC